MPPRTAGNSKSSKPKCDCNVTDLIWFGLGPLAINTCRHGVLRWLMPGADA